MRRYSEEPWWNHRWGQAGHATPAYDLAALNRDLRLIIEQDMYPAPMSGSAKAIAARTRDYFAGLGLRPAEH